ncbi:MAG: DUF397 domain-containing protein [Pseudonocardiaceae bacterium]
MEHLEWWHKSSQSSDLGNCLEVADLGNGRALRDSKNPHGTILFVTTTGWYAFCDAVKTDTLN